MSLCGHFLWKFKLPFKIYITKYSHISEIDRVTATSKNNERKQRLETNDRLLKSQIQLMLAELDDTIINMRCGGEWEKTYYNKRYTKKRHTLINEGFYIRIVIAI